MKYNLIDLINKAINIAIRKKDIYLKIMQKTCNVPAMKIILAILIKQIEDNIQYYKTLKKEMEYKNLEDIDFGIYDRISFLINEFNQSISEPEINNVRNLLEFSLALEKNTYALFMGIQGRFVRNTSDIDTETYTILSNIIENKGNLIIMLEKSIK